MNPEVLIKALRDTDGYIEKIYLNGGCYKFYKFLKAVYPNAEPCINETKDHVVTKIGERYFDIRGEIQGKFSKLSNEELLMCEKWSFSNKNWLYRECPVCGEYVFA